MKGQGQYTNRFSFDTPEPNRFPLINSFSWIQIGSWAEKMGEVQEMSDKHFIKLGLLQECKVGSTIENLSL